MTLRKQSQMNSMLQPNGLKTYRTTDSLKSSENMKKETRKMTAQEKMELLKIGEKPAHKVLDSMHDSILILMKLVKQSIKQSKVIALN